MRSVNKYVQQIAFFLATIILFQGCKIYNKTPVPMGDAISETQVKIIYINGDKTIFEQIYFKEDKLFGMPHKKQIDTIKSIIPTSYIKERKTVYYPKARTLNIKTIDGEKHVFNSYYYQNDTLFGVEIVKLKTEIIIPIETIKEIHLYSTSKSNIANAFLSIGILGLVILVTLGILLAIAAQDESGLYSGTL